MEVPWKCLVATLIDSEHNQRQCCLKSTLTATSISARTSPTLCSMLREDHLRLRLETESVCVCVRREIDSRAGCLSHTLTHSAQSTRSHTHTDSHFLRTGRDCWGDNHLTFAADNLPAHFLSKSVYKGQEVP